VLLYCEPKTPRTSRSIMHVCHATPLRRYSYNQSPTHPTNHQSQSFIPFVRSEQTESHTTIAKTKRQHHTTRLDYLIPPPKPPTRHSQRYSHCPPHSHSDPNSSDYYPRSSLLPSQTPHHRSEDSGSHSYCSSRGACAVSRRGRVRRGGDVGG